MSSKSTSHAASSPVRRIQEALRDAANELNRLNQSVGAQIDLRPMDLEVLDVVARRGPLAPSELADVLAIHRATLTGVLDRLETGGWVARAADPDDRRRIRISALPRRGGELARLYAPMSRAITQLCDGYTAEQLEVIGDFLEQIASAGRRAGDSLAAGP